MTFMPTRIGCTALLALAAVMPAHADCLLNWDKENLKLEQQAGTLMRDDEAYTRESAGATCGYGSSFLNTYSNPKSHLSLPIGPNTHRLIPLALYDKDQPHKCNRIKVRSACFQVISRSNESATVRLFDKDAPGKGAATFVVSQDGTIKGMHREYALIHRDFNTRDGKTIVLPTRMRDRIAKFKEQARSCTRGEKSKLCRSSLEAVAENAALERLRAERFVRTLDEREIGADWTAFHRSMGALRGVENIIQNIMVKNEVGSTSPYEVSDATIGGSGLSFGVRQLDIGANKDAKAIFTRNLADFSEAPDWRTRARQKRFLYGRSFQRPIRKYTVAQLLMLHESVPTLNKAMRSTNAQRRYNEHHKQFLAREARHYASLRQRCLFKDSPFLALAAIDRRNQTGSDAAIVAKVERHCNDGTPVAQVEEEVLNEFGSFRKRAANIRDLITAEGR